MKYSRRGLPWTDDEVARLIKMRRESRSWDYTAATLRRTKISCQVKHFYETGGKRTYSTNHKQRHTAVRTTQHLRTDLTGIICGDPAPGRSALESFVPPEQRRAITLAPVRMGATA